MFNINTLHDTKTQQEQIKYGTFKEPDYDVLILSILRKKKKKKKWLRLCRVRFTQPDESRVTLK